jgi:acetolactate synthase-1/2/3 large subunit
VRIERTAQFEPEFIAALERRQGTLIEVMLDPEAITTRGTLSGITAAALQKK